MCQTGRPPNTDQLYANQPSQVWFVQSYLSKSAREFAENDYLTCPLGVLLLLTTLLGSGAARADTGSQIAKTLKLKSPMVNNDLRFVRDEARSLYRTIYSELTSAETYVDNYRMPVMHVANGIFIKSGFPLQTEFRRSIRDEFHGQERELDFRNQSNSAREINYWVNNETRGIIPRFFHSPDELPRDARFIAFNILTFKDSWNVPFAPYATVVSDFWVNEVLSIRVPMMSSVEAVKYGDFSGKGFSLISKPMKNDRFSFIVIIPKERWDIASPEKVLNGQILLKDLLEETEKQAVSIKLPRFKLETQLDIIRVLESMETVDLFRRAQADLSGITTVERLHIGMLKQGLVLKVDEAGVEAAAATAGVVAPKSAMYASVEFHVDQPFVCFLYDNELHMPLVAGRITRPLNV